MCVLFCVNGYVEAYTCAGVYLEARRGSLIFLALKLQASVGCLAYYYVGAGIETVALLIMQQGFFPPAESYLSSSKNCSCSRRFVLLDFGNKVSEHLFRLLLRLFFSQVEMYLRVELLAQCEFNDRKNETQNLFSGLSRSRSRSRALSLSLSHF